MNPRPKCQNRDCFAHDAGFCNILTAHIKEPCPFFKTQEDYANDKKRCMDKLLSTEGGRKLYEKYYRG